MRFESGFLSLRWIAKPSGTRSSSSLSVRIRFSDTAVSTSGDFVRSSSPVPIASRSGSS